MDKVEFITGEYEGLAVRRFRQYRNMKQDVVADALNVSQQTVSDIEAGKRKLLKEDKEILAKLFDVPVEAIENYSEKGFNIYATSFTNTNNDQSAFVQNNHNPTFNPLDKVVELYERMIKEKDEKIAELSAALEKAKALKK
ncbi:helix-turn-helix transcriptional regulator [Chitinophaga sp. Ak27]|uniref:helix-turn-helix transcriptional regulator n=1 Tax=Chitinophaga sp. Ak27 TaxID=2726116 RepID=UPI00145D90DA|nr:helix-turn-helix transcriptional regulator [Chitinophaga sp. Ak27]NLU91356.1 helix-turn-helix domain-containing protein [Chitinophaga sp. Ak27]